MKIQVLGSGCATCKTLHKNVQDVVKKLGLNTEVEYSTDISEIVKLGAMSSPVFAIDGKIMAAGRVPSNKEIEEMICKDQNNEKPSNDSNGGCSCGGKC